VWRKSRRGCKLHEKKKKQSWVEPPPPPTTTPHSPFLFLHIHTVFFFSSLMEETFVFQWTVIRSLLSILQWWTFNVTVIIINKWIFQVHFILSSSCFPFFNNHFISLLMLINPLFYVVCCYCYQNFTVKQML
jgi:hypothetical protein